MVIHGLFATPLVATTFGMMSVLGSFFEKMLADYFFVPFLVSCALFLFGFFLFDKIAKALLGNKIDETYDSSPGHQYDVELRKGNLAIGKKVTGFFAIAIPVFYFVYIAINGTMMQGHVMEWLNLIIRWAHVVAGIMWIGASFYFIFLENNLNRTKNVRDELAGNLWAIHGGGFYFLEKYKVAPKNIPKDLHWFKYEAYMTWITGFMLLWLVYYMDPRAFLINTSVADISVTTAILIGIGTLVVGWVVYDLMCKSPLINNSYLFTILGLLLLTGLSYFLVNVFSSRAAFIHVGAVIGTIMAANVFFIIIPSQKALVRAAISGEPLDASLGKKSQQRSLHNNYFTLPVIFIMISNHYPSTFGHEYNWLILMGIVVASAGIKHYWNLIERGQHMRFILPLSVASLVAIALVTSPLADRKDGVDLTIPVEFSHAQKIIQVRCQTCHSQNPSDPLWGVAPGGVMFDTPEQIKAQADNIMRTSVRTNFMPLGNLTNITEEERLALHRWIAQGAKITDE